MLVRMEQEQRVADDARRFAEQDASLQRCIADEAKVVLLTLVHSSLKHLSPCALDFEPREN